MNPASIPSISLVIPSSNSLDSLRDLLDHLDGQAGAAPQILIIDGRSSDGTIPFLQALRREHTQWTSAPDDGIYDAINKGIAMATGDLVAVIGCDDRLPDASTLSTVASMAAAHPADLYAGGALLLHPDGRQERRADEPFGIGALASGIPFCHNALYVRRDAYTRVGPYDTSYRICADAHWVHRAIRAQLSCFRIDQALVHFGMDGTSSINPDTVLAESYRTIMANFPGLDPSSARAVLEAARGWGAPEPALRAAAQFDDGGHLAAALRAALTFRSHPYRLHGLEVPSSTLIEPPTAGQPLATVSTDEAGPAASGWTLRLKSRVRHLVSALRP